MNTPTTRETADHAELARLAEAAAKGEWWSDDDVISHQEVSREDERFIYAFTPAVCSALLSEIAALRGEMERVAGESIWWKGVIGNASHQPSGEVRSIKHMHPAMVKPIYDAHKGTAVADVIAGLIFSLSITQNREQFLVEHANDRATQAERQRDELLDAAHKLSAAISWTDYPFIDNDTSREELISRLGFMQKDAEQPRAFLANQGANQ